MKFRTTLASVAVVLAAAAPVVTAQMPQEQSQTKTGETKKVPGQPDPNDRGGEFIITGCLTQATGVAGQQPAFVLTHVTPGQANVGVSSNSGSMGTGAAVTGVTHGSAAEKTNPPDIVRGEYRIVSKEYTELAKFSNQQVEAKGRLRGSMTGDHTVTSTTPAKADGSTSKTGTNAEIFEATSVKKIGDTCPNK